MAKIKRTTRRPRSTSTPTSTESKPSTSAGKLSLRDWISQATEEDLADLERLVEGSITAHEGTKNATNLAPGGRPRFTAATLGEVAGFLGVQLQTVKEWRTGPDPMPGSEGEWPLAD